MKFRKKPVVIEAVQWDGEDAKGEVYDFIKDCKLSIGFVFDEPFLKIRTLEGEMTAEPGDWIIRGIKGEFYPCKPDVFAETYEPVENALPEKRE